MHPVVRRDMTVVEHIAGREVLDPYRWLEEDSEETSAFVAAQNALARPILDALPERPAFVRILDEMLSAPTRTSARRAGEWMFAWHNDGANQPRLVRARSFAALEDAETVLDPNLLSDDGTRAVVAAIPNDDASLLAYAVSDGGSDWLTIHVRDLRTLEDLDVTIEWAKWNAPTWLPGGRAFTYWAYPEPQGNALTEESGAGEMRAFDLDTGETRVAWAPDDPRVMAYRMPDDDWFVLFCRKGMERETTIRVRRHEDEDLRVLVDGRAQWWPVGVRAGELICGTAEDAPNGRVVAVDLSTGEQRTLVAEHPTDVLEDFSMTASGFVAHYMNDAQSRLQLFGPDGGPGDHLPVGEGVTVVGLDVHERHDSFTVATSRFSDAGDRHEAVVEGGRLVRWETAERPAGSVAVPCGIERIRVPNGDVEVPAFLITPEGADDGPRPVLMWGYGGFNIPVTPSFRAIFGAWVAAGGTLAVVNLRGGGEFGEEWHEAGTKERKQNVFDDLYAVAPHLIDARVTTPSQLALHGRSNGGLLCGAALTQRPDLWAAVLPGVGVLDMLRYHRFTIGWSWASDYGNPDEPEAAEYLLAYSPLHNIRKVEYPPTLITTADRDDRVVPAHSFKFAAELQHTGLGAPFLLSVDTRSGHGAGKPKDAQIEEFADQLAFAAHHTGLKS